MWINPNTQQVFNLHHEIRAAFNNVSFPASMSDDDISSVGLLPVQQTAKPTIDAATQDVADAAPIEINGTWTQQWQIVDLSPEQVEERYKSGVPVSVSMRQARLALLAEGHLATVNAAMETQSDAAKIEWEYATEVRRDSPLTAAMGAVLGLTNLQLDSLFVAASVL